jgi:Arc/MetJ family transcription regulator
MRTTIRLDDELLADAKHLALRTGRTLTAVIEDALREALARADAAPAARPFKLITFSGNGVKPGVDLDDSAALLDRMERDADSL